MANNTITPAPPADATAAATHLLVPLLFLLSLVPINYHSSYSCRCSRGDNNDMNAMTDDSYQYRFCGYYYVDLGYYEDLQVGTAPRPPLLLVLLHDYDNWLLPLSRA